jgi:hypothetical protein
MSSVTRRVAVTICGDVVTSIDVGVKSNSNNWGGVTSDTWAHAELTIHVASTVADKPTPNIRIVSPFLGGYRELQA